MTLTVHDRPVLKLTVDDVMVMAEHGLFDERRAELIDGVLIDMAGQLPPHSWPIRVLQRWLSPLIASGGFDVDIQLPFAVPDQYSLPEPDVKVVPRVGRDEMPSRALLIVEVAHTSLRPDATRKVELYAEAGVPDYWVVDVLHRQLQVRRDPVGDRYGSLAVLGPEDAVRPLALDVAPLDLDELLAG